MVNIETDIAEVAASPGWAIAKAVWKPVCVVLLIAGAYLWAHHRGAVSQKATDAKELAVYVDAVGKFKDANNTNLATIAKLGNANALWASAASAAQAKQIQAVASLRSDNAALSARLVKAQAQRKAIYARDPNARAWGNAAVPRSVADSLWPEDNGSSHPNR